MRRHATALLCVAALLLAAGCARVPLRSAGPTRASAEAERTVLSVPPMDNTGSGGNFRSLTSKAETSALPNELVVYKVKPASVSKEDVRGHTRRLGIDADPEELDDRYVVAGSSATFEMEKVSGSFDFTTEEFEKQTKALQRTLSDADYRKRAETFLVDSGLKPSTAEFRDVNRGNVVGTFENGKWVERPYMIEVRYGHKPLGGVAFDQGVGPKIVVQFGEDGQVIGAMSVWREVEPFAAYPLKTPEEAIESARNGRAQLFDVGTDDTGIVDDISLSYMNEPLGYDQRYVVPAYVLKGSARGGRRFTGIAQAIPDSLLFVDPSLVHPVVAPQSSGKK